MPGIRQVQDLVEHTVPISQIHGFTLSLLF